MAAIYLKHAVHGSKVAISEQEAKADEVRGWTRFDPGALLRAPIVDNKFLGPVDALVAIAPKRRGRPPKGVL